MQRYAMKHGPSLKHPVRAVADMDGDWVRYAAVKDALAIVEAQDNAIIELRAELAAAQAEKPITVPQGLGVGQTTAQKNHRRLRDEVEAWKGRFLAIVGSDSPDAAGNAVIAMRDELALWRSQFRGILQCNHPDSATYAVVSLKREFEAARSAFSDTKSALDATTEGLKRSSALLAEERALLDESAYLHEHFLKDGGARLKRFLTTYKARRAERENGVRENLTKTAVNAAMAALMEACRAILRAPSIGSEGPGSSTLVVQEFVLRAVRAALATAEQLQPTVDSSVATPATVVRSDLAVEKIIKLARPLSAAALFRSGDGGYVGKDDISVDLRLAVDPVRHWFDGDGNLEPPRTDVEIAKMAVEELRSDRNKLLDAEVQIAHLQGLLAVEKAASDAYRKEHRHADGSICQHRPGGGRRCGLCADLDARRVAAHAVANSECVGCSMTRAKCDIHKDGLCMPCCATCDHRGYSKGGGA